MYKEPKLNKGGGTLSLLSSTNSQKTKINGKWSVHSCIWSANGICGSKHRQVIFTSENFRENIFKPLFIAQTPVYNFSWEFKVDPDSVSKKAKYILPSEEWQTYHKNDEHFSKFEKVHIIYFNKELYKNIIHNNAYP